MTDIVLLWVDGSDPEWIKERLSYQTGTDVPDEQAAAAAKNFRDWGLLPYWFRGVERFAPWVRTVHFVTWGHLPAFLNPDAPKLHIVNHRDFMPEGSLPTYNSRALELNLHRIPGLSEQFVYTNDDTYFVGPTREREFFSHGLPRDCAVISPVRPERYGTGAIQINDLEIVSDHLGGFDAVRRHPEKFFSPVYGPDLLRTLTFLPMRQLLGFYEPHLPVSYRKETYRTLWALEPEVLMETSRSQFKRKNNVNQWLMRYWQLASGGFVPRSPQFGKFFDLYESFPQALRAITSGRYRMICLNDRPEITDPGRRSALLQREFSRLLPEKSSFER